MNTLGTKQCSDPCIYVEVVTLGHTFWMGKKKQDLWKRRQNIEIIILFLKVFIFLVGNGSRWNFRGYWAKSRLSPWNENHWIWRYECYCLSPKCIKKMNSLILELCFWLFRKWFCHSNTENVRFQKIHFLPKILFHTCISRLWTFSKHCLRLSFAHLLISVFLFNIYMNDYWLVYLNVYYNLYNTHIWDWCIGRKR